MPFDQSTRNRLARFVADARTLLTEEFTRQLQHDYGLDPGRGEVTPLDRLGHLDDARRETAIILRETLAHYLAGEAKPSAKSRQEALTRIVREQAFTVLNRLCALRMAEARELLVESISRGYQSRGFRMYASLVGSALGETGDAYRIYLFSLFDEFAIDLAVLFDRYSTQGRLFPREAALMQLLDLINHFEIAPLWAEDETIGWIYQYFNSQEERRQMRAESQAPRNSRELAVRNQFFTPRYVVEFLTDNTLGRIWYEMTRGETRLAEQCRYLVRRPVEIFLPATGFDSFTFDLKSHELIFEGKWRDLPEEADWSVIGNVALALDGYNPMLLRCLFPGDKRKPFSQVADLANGRMDEYFATGEWRGSSIELWLCLFFEQRRYHHFGRPPEGKELRPLQALYRAWRSALEREQGGADLSQEELLRQPVYIAPRPPKDPRTLLMLDPACGSMHFGLYAFDLFETIYEEAWAMRLIDHAEFGEGEEAYANFCRQIPRLIIEHNIHGIDIDPRAVQIAGLSLWLRAQRSWRDQGVRAADRPVIRKSNIVCAEPMPGDKAQLDEFLKSLRDERLESLIRRVLDVPADQRVRATPAMADALCELVSTVWHEMALAGEAGSLLKIEESLAAAIAHARDEWETRLPLFRVETFRMTGEKPQVNYLRTVPGEEADFWERAEALVMAALQEYAEQAQDGAGTARRLFAEDAARGFAFIDLRRKRYDVAVMNPPFGVEAVATKRYLAQEYNASKNDVYAAFVESGLSMLVLDGLMGAITSRTGFFLSNFEKWRSEVILSRSSPILFADLGAGVLDSATVDTSAYVLAQGKQTRPCSFFRLIESASKASELQDIVAGRTRDEGAKALFNVIPAAFTRLPGSPFAYWISSRVVRLFHAYPSLGETCAIDMGMSTKDDERFTRLRCEVPSYAIGWCNEFRPYAKGGSSSLIVTAIDCVVLSHGDYRQLKANLGHKYPYLKGNSDWVLHPEYHYGSPGLTFGRRVRRFRPLPLPRDVVFSDSNPSIFAPKEEDLFWLGPYLASPIVQCLLSLFAPPRKMEVGYVASLPYPVFSDRPRERLSEIGRLTYLAGVSFNSRYETDARFVVPSDSAGNPTSIDNDLESPSEVDRLVADSLGLNSQDIDELLATFSAATGLAEEANEPSHTETDSDDQDNVGTPLGTREIAECRCSYCLGCSLGRWDIRYATGERQPPPLPDPFDPLPVCPPGMLQNTAGLPAAPEDVPAGYPLRISWPGILVDDPGHPEDIVARVRDALAVIWPDTHDAIEQEACQILGVDSLRSYFAAANSFFDDHLKRYSKSRRAAPIYWPLSTSSGAYTLWLYYHRLSDQILYTCVNDFVDPKLAECERQASALRSRSRSAQEEKELERLGDLAAELKEFRGELLRVAQFWRPNLNDGVQITAAPLWRLFRHRNWQKRLQETWDKLEAGDYDWAHLALSIWPQRVVPKCLDDRSLAIAHDVEDLFWVEEDGKWRTLRSPAEEIAGQKQRAKELLGKEKARKLEDALIELARGPARSLSAQQAAQHLAEGDWDDSELALLVWPARVAEKCWADPFLTDRLLLNLPPKRTQAARKRFVNQRIEAGCPHLADALLATLDDDTLTVAQILAELEAGRRDQAPLALALYPERVVDACTKDAELAAAHDLRRFFWVQRPDGTWRRRVDPRREAADEAAARV